MGFREVRLTALLSLAGVQGAAAALDDCEHGHADLRWAGLRAGEGRARHHVLHPAPDPLLGHHHHDQHRYSAVQYSTVQHSIVQYNTGQGHHNHDKHRWQHLRHNKWDVRQSDLYVYEGSVM